MDPMLMEENGSVTLSSLGIGFEFVEGIINSRWKLEYEESLDISP